MYIFYLWLKTSLRKLNICRNTERHFWGRIFISLEYILNIVYISAIYGHIYKENLFKYIYTRLFYMYTLIIKLKHLYKLMINLFDVKIIFRTRNVNRLIGIIHDRPENCLFEDKIFRTVPKTAKSPENCPFIIQNEPKTALSYTYTYIYIYILFLTI